MSNKNNILIIGSGAVVSALAEKLAKTPNIGEIYAAPGNSIHCEYFKNIDIREDDYTELLKFALEKNILLTIPVSNKAFKADIVSFFQSNGQNIFGPLKTACNIALNNSIGKKFLYKIHAQTSKFGIFDKLQQAEEFLTSANFPLTIKCNEYDNINDRLVCPTINLAKEFLDTLFSRNETSVLIEEFVFGHNFTIYYITDGYSAIPITTVGNYKFMQDGEGGIYTPGMGCFSPDYKISETILSRVDNIIKNTITALDKKGTPYVGILGIECTITGEDKFYVNEFKPFLQDFDARAVLNLIDDNLINIFLACIQGLFADEYETIKTNNYSSVAATILARQNNKTIKGLENINAFDCKFDFINTKLSTNQNYLTQKGPAFIITNLAGTLSRAKNNLYEELSQITFDGMKYRKDILSK